MLELQMEAVEKTDWKYSLRREMQLILPAIYLGPYSAATVSKFESLIFHGITHIICIRHHLEARFIRPNFSETIKYLVIDIADDPCSNIIQHFPSTYSFIDEAVRNNGKVLIHGNNGISRSASVVIAYMMVKFEITFREAYAWVLDRRCCVMPNSGFIQQLKEYEPIYQAQLSAAYNSMNTSPTNCSKRHLED